jgi:FKBP-type peptidyl-prolyl cis-trans isomerase
VFKLSTGFFVLTLIAYVLAPSGAGEEVQTTASGLQYEVLKEGGDGPHPKMGDTVKVHYTGTLTDGTKFDSSRDRGAPAEFMLGSVIEGWNEGLQLMTVGAQFKFTIPPGLGYGARGAPPRIPANATLVFDVELLEVIPGPELPEFCAGNPDQQVTLENGIVYEVLAEGAGEPPKSEDTIELEYAVWTPEGRLLMSSAQQKAPVKASPAMMRFKFLQEAPLLMKPGSKFRFEVPPDLCFGDQPPPGLKPDANCVWQLELVRVIEPLPVPEFVMPAAEDLQTTASGLQYQVVREGSGDSPKMGQEVTVHYAGWLTDGTNFDSSFSRGEMSSFVLGRVVPGWNEGLQLMKPGAIYRFVIPPGLAYGARGNPPVIGANATLVFYVELKGEE